MLHVNIFINTWYEVKNKKLLSKNIFYIKIQKLFNNILKYFTNVLNICILFFYLFKSKT